MNFDLIFASQSKLDEKYEWDEINYARGWGYLGYSIPPPMELFNQMQYQNDMKSKYLHDTIVQNDIEIKEALSDATDKLTQKINSLSNRVDEFVSTDIYIFKGTVETYNDLPTENKNGDVYNIKRSSKANGIKAGDNVAWNGTEWDNLSGGQEMEVIEDKEIDQIIGGY